MSDRSADEVAGASATIWSALRAWVRNYANPFMSVSTPRLPDSPDLKLTDRGLVDVLGRRLVSAVLGEAA